MSTQTRRGLIFIGIFLSPFIIGLLFTYQWIRVPFPTDMAISPAVDYQEGPRRTAPERSVPLQGQALIPGEFPQNPIPSDSDSLQRGEILYHFHCSLCHGETGRGDGALSQYFARTPENLSGAQAAAEFDGSVYLAILQGFGEMPSLAENLTRRERWDIINYIRTLPSGGE